MTRPEAALRTVDVHHKAFTDAGLEAAFARAIGVVVQPGVEFASTEVIAYKPEKAAGLVEALASLPGFVFEAHSTDYQPAACLDALVSDGFAILKVGPWLTFALREALYGLDCIARVLDPASTDGGLPAAMEALMLKEPGNWRKYYQGGSDELMLQRHFAKVEDLDPTSSRAVAEYLSVLDEAAFGWATSTEPKAISPTDPAARYTAAVNSAAVYAYSDNDLVVSQACGDRGRRGDDGYSSSRGRRGQDNARPYV